MRKSSYWKDRTGLTLFDIQHLLISSGRYVNTETIHKMWKDGTLMPLLIKALEKQIRESPHQLEEQLKAVKAKWQDQAPSKSNDSVIK